MIAQNASFVVNIDKYIDANTEHHAFHVTPNLKIDTHSTNKFIAATCKPYTEFYIYSTVENFFNVYDKL